MAILFLIFIISIIIVVLVSVMTNLPPHVNSETLSSNQTVYGNIMYRFISDGIVQTNQEINNTSVLFWTYKPIINGTSFFRLRIWNISKIMITDLKNGTQKIINYSMENEEMIAEGSNGYFMGLIKFGQLNINYTDLGALYNGGVFDINPTYSFLKCEGELDHQSFSIQDFQL
jgi:hypothetical protein